MSARRIDHIAYRVADRNETAKFLSMAFGYTIADEFDIHFENDEKARCLVLQGEPDVPPRIIHHDIYPIPGFDKYSIERHAPPDLFVSDGTPNSIVGRWVAQRNNTGGIHHIAYEVDDVLTTMNDWKARRLATFTTDLPITCTGLTQCFTNPHPLTNIIYEFIKREKQGFCKENVKQLMQSTASTDLLANH